MRMSADEIPEKYRLADFFSHIDMGFLNRRLAISALGPIRDVFLERQRPGEDHMTVLANDHLLVTMLIDVCSEIKAPTLAEARTLGKPKHLFMSIERLESCPEVYEAQRVMHAVHLDIDYGKPVNIVYHTSHIVSDTGRMTLERGYHDGYRQAMIGLLHDRGESFEIEPIVIGAPWLDHAQRGRCSRYLARARLRRDFARGHRRVRSDEGSCRCECGRVDVGNGKHPRGVRQEIDRLVA